MNLKKRLAVVMATMMCITSMPVWTARPVRVDERTLKVVATLKNIGPNASFQFGIKETMLVGEPVRIYTEKISVNLIE